MRKKRLVKPYKKTEKKTEPEKANNLHRFFFASSIALVLSLSLFNIYSFIQGGEVQVKTVLAETRDISHEKEFWMEKLNEHPDYIPGVLELAKIELEIGETEFSEELIERAKKINPNDERVRKFESLFSGRF